MEQTREYRPEKVAAVAAFSEKLSNAKSVFLTDYSGLSVAEISELRKKFRESQAEYFVVKNTLARLSAKDAGKESILPYLEGPIAVAISYEDPASPARVLADFLKNHPKPEVKACLIEDDILPGSEAAEIAKWATREELLAKVVGSLNAPISGLVMTLSGIQRKLLYAFNAIASKKENQ